MFKGKFLVLSIIAAALLCWQVMPASVSTVNSGIVDPCFSTASSAGGCWIVCPQGDGPPLNNLAPASGDATISVTVKDGTDTAVPNIPGTDFWLVGCGDLLALCGGSAAIGANGATDVNGDTTIEAAMSAGGCDVGVNVVVQGVILKAANCVDNLCLLIITRSPDIDGSLAVAPLDFQAFGNAWEPLGGTYAACADFNCDNVITAIDFQVFGNHWQHSCN